jgi:2-isopropylmalate synthase
MIRENVPGIENAIISVHCHNDLGLAVANSLAAVMNGARQVEVAVNGIGERAGNASLEEIVMALYVRHDLYGIGTQIDTTQLTRASRLVSKVTGMSVQPNKAVVGANAFAHEAGIHQDGMLKHEQTYEIMRPETVGAGKTQLVLGKHSGRHAFANRLAELGYPVSGDGLDKAFARFKQVADKKKVITDADLVALISDELYQPTEYWKLDAIQVGCGTGMPTATVRLTGPDGHTRTAAAVGTGPVDAVYKAIQDLVHVPCTLLEYTVHSVTEGIDALGEVSVRVSPHGDAATSDKVNPQYEHSRARVFHGHGANTDVIVASAKAYLAAINRILALKEGTGQDRQAAGSAA